MEIRLEIDQSKLDYDEINKKILEKIDNLSSEDILKFAYPKTYMSYYEDEFPEDRPNNLSKLITETILASIMTKEDDGDFQIFNEKTGSLTARGENMVNREFQMVFKNHINKLMKPIIESEEINKLLVDSFFNHIAAIFVQALRDYCDSTIYTHKSQDDSVKQILQEQINEIKSRFNMYY